MKKAHASAYAGLKNVTKQADDLRIQLRQSEEKLTTEQQAVSTLKAELARTKEEARLGMLSRRLWQPHMIVESVILRSG